jgi:hypothetical protein
MTKNNYTNQTFDQMNDMMKNFVPVVKPNKNGYEIRTKVLEMAQNQMWQDYHAKWGAWETKISKDGDEIVTEVKMPEVPGVESVLSAAEKMYAFVTGNNK